MLGECGMKARDKTALRKNSVALLRELVVDELLIQILQADDVLTEGMAETVLTEPTSFKRSSRLLAYLPKRGPRAFSSFCAALRETEQQHLCELLVRFRDQQRSSVYDPAFPLPTQECAVPAKRTRTHESVEMCLDADSPVTTAVLPCTSEFYLSHSAQAYPMCSSPRGLALVVSNVQFERELSELDTRRGGEVDEEVLRRLFTELDFTVIVQKDLTAQVPLLAFRTSK